MPQPPPETSTTGRVAGSPSAAARGGRRRRVLELRAHEPAHLAHVGARAGDLQHLRARLRVDDQVQVDRRVRPVAQRGEVGDRRRRRARPGGPRGAARRGSRSCRGRWRRSTSGRTRSTSRSSAGPPTSTDSRRMQPAGRRQGGDQPVLEVEQRPHVLEDRLRAAPDDGQHHRSHGGQAVHHLRLGAARAQRVGEQLGRQVVARADVGGQDQHARHGVSRSGGWAWRPAGRASMRPAAASSGGTSVAPHRRPSTCGSRARRRSRPR